MSKGWRLGAEIRAWLDKGYTVIWANKVWVAATLLVVSLVWVSVWFLGLAVSPARYAGPEVSLEQYGLPGVTVQLIYPTRLGLEEDANNPGVVTLLAVADTQENIQAFDVVLPLPSQALAFVDSEGRRVAGRIWVVPGYPDAIPYEMGVAHGETQLQGRQFRPYTVSITPVIRRNEQSWPAPELAFDVRLESRWERAYRWLGEAFSNVLLPYLLLALLAMSAISLWQRHQCRQRHDEEKELAQAYVRLGERIKLEDWAAARQEIETIRLRDASYRDVQSLDTMVSAAETADWRREQLYGIGIQAYKRRDWPAAVQAFRAIEQETPYYRDVRFLRRTSALYADLTSRDRSLRVAAAHQLGQVADLLDTAPLLGALGDSAPEVREQAQDGFRAIGAVAYDTLIAGLAHQNGQVVEGANALLNEAGQQARDNLLSALHGSDPQVTSRVAMLLSRLGARKELAEALLWVAPHHQKGIVTALLDEGSAVTGALIDALLHAPPERRETVISALAALKVQVDVNDRLQESLRSTKVPKERALLQRAINAAAEPFHGDVRSTGRPGRSRGVTTQRPAKKTDGSPKMEPSSELPQPRRLRLLDRRRN